MGTHTHTPNIPQICVRAHVVAPHRTRSPDPEILQALELADSHLADAEDVFWQLSEAVESNDLSDDIDHIMENIWDVQQQLQDLQDEFHQ